MKKKNAVRIVFVACGLFLSAVIIIAMSIIIVAKPIPKLLPDYASEEELMSVLDGESFDELADEVNELGDDFEYQGLMHYAQAIYGKIYDISVKNLTNIITSKTNTNNLRCLLMELVDNEQKPILLDYDILVKELKDKSNNTNFRQSILLYLTEPYTYGADQRNEELLILLTDDEDDEIAATALQTLYYMDNEKAIPIVKEILAGDGNDNRFKTMNRAIDLQCVQLSNTKNNDDLKEFLSFCERKLDENCFVGPILYGLISINDFNAMKMVLSCQYSDDVIKNYCVYNNYKCLSEWFNDGEITEEKVGYMIECLGYYPAKQAIPDLQNALEKYSVFFAEHPKLRDDMQESIDRLNTEGEDIYGAWLE